MLAFRSRNLSWILFIAAAGRLPARMFATPVWLRKDAQSKGIGQDITNAGVTPYRVRSASRMRLTG